MTDTINYSVREFRHIVGRFLHAQRCARHLVNPLREVLLSAEASGFDALTELERSRGAIAGITGSLKVVGTDELDAGGQPAYAVAPDLVDRLLVAAAARSGPVTVAVLNLTGASALGHLGDYARVRGLALEAVVLTDSAVRVRGRQEPAPPVADPRESEGRAVAEALVRGFDAEVGQFWRLFHESNEALTPDSDLSRQHAGAQVRDADGKVIGEVDEESYLYIRSQVERQSREVAR